jgi:hypothetical protein
MNKQKEQVIVFDGEDKFIAPRKRFYDASKERPESDALSTKEGDLFKAYMRNQATPVVIPSPDEPDFCTKIQSFLKTRCNGKATPEQLMQAYQLFQDNCVEKPEEKSVEGERRPAVAEPVTADLTFPDWNVLSCDEIRSEITRLEQFLMVSRLQPEARAQYNAAIDNGRAALQEKCPINPPALPDMPPPPPTGGGVATPPPQVGAGVNPLGVSLSTPTLGQPPRSASAPSAGQEPAKKGTNWLLWVILGGAALYLLTRKKD